jgi:hypothetical protein
MQPAVLPNSYGMRSIDIVDLWAGHEGEISCRGSSFSIRIGLAIPLFPFEVGMDYPQTGTFNEMKNPAADQPCY